LVDVGEYRGTRLFPLGGDWDVKANIPNAFSGWLKFFGNIIYGDRANVCYTIANIWYTHIGQAPGIPHNYSRLMICDQGQRPSSTWRVAAALDPGEYEVFFNPNVTSFFFTAVRVAVSASNSLHLTLQ